VKPTVKIGLSAPFEGLDRDLGYEVLHAVRLAVRERNADGGVGQRYLVEFVALNDHNEAEKAVEQARKMAVDPGVLGVLGGWSQETMQAVSEYEQLGLAFLVPDVDIIQSGPLTSADTDFAARYGTLSSGAPPGSAAVWAYSAANRLLDAIDAATLSEGRPTRSGVQGALTSLH
jgi:ABC-type branched-subunit amino acid transport system substrate-binding protein